MTESMLNLTLLERNALLTIVETFIHVMNSRDDTAFDPASNYLLNRVYAMALSTMDVINADITRRPN